MQLIRVDVACGWIRFLSTLITVTNSDCYTISCQVRKKMSCCGVINKLSGTIVFVCCVIAWMLTCTLLYKYFTEKFENWFGNFFLALCFLILVISILSLIVLIYFLNKVYVMYNYNKCEQNCASSDVGLIDDSVRNNILSESINLADLTSCEADENLFSHSRRLKQGKMSQLKTIHINSVIFNVTSINDITFEVGFTKERKLSLSAMSTRNSSHIQHKYVLIDHSTDGIPTENVQLFKQDYLNDHYQQLKLDNLQSPLSALRSVYARAMTPREEFFIDLYKVPTNNTRIVKSESDCSLVNANSAAAAEESSHFSTTLMIYNNRRKDIACREMIKNRR